MQDASDKPKKIVVIGGGTGVFTVLTGLKKRGHDLSAIVTMADDGGSTGQLREEFGILPPGDVRRALVALADADSELLGDLFTYRFEEGEGLSGHAMGNLLLTALERITGSFERAIAAASKLLGVKGRVIPVTLNNVRLKAVLKDGTEVFGESAIDVPKEERLAGIERIELVGEARANPKALDAIAAADLIVIGPGDLFTSVLPNIAVEGIADGLLKTRAKKAYVVNVMTKYGETDDFSARDFVDAIEGMLGENVLDTVIVNTVPPKEEPRDFYATVRRTAMPVLHQDAKFNDATYEIIATDVIRHEGKYIRHDGIKLANVLEALID